MATAQLYFRKADAISALKPNEYLFGVDTVAGTKTFFVATHASIIRSLKKDRNIYEHYGYLKDEDDQSIDQQTRFFIDLDYKLSVEHNTEFETKEELLKTLTKSVEKYMKSKGIVVGRRIVLDASTGEKFSFHVVYPDAIFCNISNMKAFAKDYADVHEQFDGIFDTCVYANRCFRCINQSKLGKGNQLIGDCDIADSLLLGATTDTPIIYVSENAVLKKKVEKLSKLLTSNVDPLSCTKVNIKKQVIPMTHELMKDIVAALAVERAEGYAP
jgi:hypothetical protein